MPIEPYYSEGGITLHHARCEAVLESLPDVSIDLIATDPPYFKVKAEWWDRQWEKPACFLKWMGELCDQWKRVLKPNGSLYVFASPQMSHGVEGVIRERFNVLNRITWRKYASERMEKGGWWEQASKESLRSFFPQTEAIIFAEHYNSDNYAIGSAGYVAKCDELRGFVFEPLRAYIAGEFERAGMLTTEGKIAANVACGFSASSGGMASRHYFSQSQWQLPTQQHYEAMRQLLNQSGGNYLRREYEDLRREYEDLRRPFNASDKRPYTDVWDFATVQDYPGKHPCEKPLRMMEHIIETSSREGATVLDCFAGSGVVGEACRNFGRKAILCEVDEKWARKIKARMKQRRLLTA